jgi:ABC-type uncharacterized transport system permease subunit
VLWLASGFVIPVGFFPAGLRVLVDWSPLIPLLMAPVRVATGAPAALPWPARLPGSWSSG